MNPITVMSYEGTITRIIGSKTSKVSWITDKSRLFFDAVNNIKKSINNLETKDIWNSYFINLQNYMYYKDFVSSNFTSSKFLFFVINNVSNETLNILMLLNNTFSFTKVRKLEETKLENVDFESNFQMNLGSNDSFLFKSNFCLLIGNFVRYEGPYFNLKLKQRSLRSKFKLLSFGCFMDFTVPYVSLGSSINTLRSVIEGKNLVCLDLVQSKNPFIVCSNELFKRNDNKSLLWGLNYLMNFSIKNYIGLNILNSSINDTGLNYANKFLPLNSEDLNNSKGLYFLNANVPSVCNTKKLVEIKMLKIFNNTNSSVLKQKLFDQSISYIGIDNTIKRLSSDYSYLPIQLVFENNESFIDTEGSIKKMNKIITPEINSKNSWQLLRKILINFDKFYFVKNMKDSNNVVFNSNTILNFKNFINFNRYAVCVLTSLNTYLLTTTQPITRNNKSSFKSSSFKLFETKVKHWLDDFFSGGKDGFTQHSTGLSDCSNLMRLKMTNFC